MIISETKSTFWMLLFIAWRNIWRNPVRSILTVSALVSGLALVVFYAAMMEGMIRQMEHQATSISSGHLQVHREAYIDDQDIYATLPWSYLDSLSKTFPNAHIAPRLYSAGLASSGHSSSGVYIKAVDFSREQKTTTMLSHIRKGVANLEKSPTGYNVVVGAQFAKNMKLDIGDELVLVSQAVDGSIGNGLFQVSAILKPLDPHFDRMGVLMSIESFKDFMSLQDGFHELVFHLEGEVNLEAFQSKLSTALDALVKIQPLDDLGGPHRVRNWRELTPALADMLSFSQIIIYIFGIIIISVAAMGMLNTMLMAVYERSHEFGVLVAIGMQRRLLVVMVLLESFFLALIAAVAGILAGVAIVKSFGEKGIDLSGSLPDGFDWGGIVFDPVMQLSIEPSHVIQSAILMMVITLLASLFPLWRILRLKPAEVMG